MGENNIIYKSYKNLTKKEHLEVLMKRNYYRKYSFKKEKIITFKEHLAYIDNLEDDRLYLAVVYDEKIVLSINLQKIDENKKSANWGFFKINQIDIYFILENFIKKYFYQMDFTFLFSEINIDNKKSIEIHEKLGFKQVALKDTRVIYMLEKDYKICQKES